jgi:hypothetical protein
MNAVMALNRVAIRARLVVYTCNSSTRKTEVGGSKPTCYVKVLSQNTKTKSTISSCEQSFSDTALEHVS